MISVDVTQLLVGMTNEPIFSPQHVCQLCRRPTDGARYITLREVCCESLNNVDGKMPFDEKMRMFMLGQKIGTTDSVELSSEEVVLIKKQVAATYRTDITGAVGLLLDPPALAK
jgi:hypothetical protein